MFIRLISCVVLSAALVVAAAVAAEPQVVEGTVVSAGGGQLQIRDNSGKEQSFTVDAQTRVTVNGKPGRLEDLKTSTRVQVMLSGQGQVVSVASLDKEK